MNNKDSAGELDEQIAARLDMLTQKLSRRGLLARCGKFALALLGITVVPLLPADRTAYGAMQSPEDLGCDWRFCGAHGYQCAPCCTDNTGSSTACPSCTYRGGSWSGCCSDQNGCKHMITYIDCCGGSDQNCRGTLCSVGFGGNYCSGDPYRCTIVSVGDPNSC